MSRNTNELKRKERKKVLHFFEGDLFEILYSKSGIYKKCMDKLTFIIIINGCLKLDTYPKTNDQYPGS